MGFGEELWIRRKVWSLLSTHKKRLYWDKRQLPYEDKKELFLGGRQLPPDGPEPNGQAREECDNPGVLLAIGAFDPVLAIAVVVITGHFNLGCAL